MQPLGALPLKGSTNFQQSALATHANSSAHKSALLMQKTRVEAGKMGVNAKTRSKALPAPEYGVVASQLNNLANKLSSLVTREDLERLQAELRLMTSSFTYIIACRMGDPTKIYVWKIQS